MPELGDQIHQYLDAAAAPVQLDAVTHRHAAGPIRIARWRVAVAVAACLVVLVGVGLVVGGGGSTERVETGPGTTVADEWGWSTPYGLEGPQPAVPAGWKTLDFLDLRFSVPADWAVPIGTSCVSAPGLVQVSTSPIVPEFCPQTTGAPLSTVTIQPAPDASQSGEATEIGTLPATRTADGYVLADGYLVAVSGPQSEAVLATFTDSGTHRLLQDGPEADTSGWQRITYRGLSFLAPPGWQSIDLAAPDVSLAGDPGVCGSPVFPPDGPRPVYLDEHQQGPAISCPSLGGLALEPTEGMWVREPSGDQVLATSDAVAASGQVNGLDMKVLRSAPQLWSPAESPFAVLVVDDGTTTVLVWLGVGTDASIARTILRSMQATG